MDAPVSAQVKGRFGTYSIGHNSTGEYVTVGHKGSTIPFGRQDVALVFRELHKLLYSTESLHEQQ